MTSRTVEEVAAERGMAQRDCRSCPKFEPQGDGLGYGWCRAHRQFVKLYQMADGFWSQCQFKALVRDRDDRETAAVISGTAPSAVPASAHR